MTLLRKPAWTSREREPHLQLRVDELLAGARAARSDPHASEAAIRAALAACPQSRDAQLAAYKFYFYNHRLDAALPHAEALLAQAARQLNIAAAWCDVGPADAAFGDLEPEPGFYLQALIAWGYCKIRLGDVTAGCAALTKACELDPRDRFGARRVLAVIASACTHDDA